MIVQFSGSVLAHYVPVEGNINTRGKEVFV